MRSKQAQSHFHAMVVAASGRTYGRPPSPQGSRRSKQCQQPQAMAVACILRLLRTALVAQAAGSSVTADGW